MTAPTIHTHATTHSAQFLAPLNNQGAGGQELGGQVLAAHELGCQRQNIEPNAERSRCAPALNTRQSLCFDPVALVEAVELAKAELQQARSAFWSATGTLHATLVDPDTAYARYASKVNELVDEALAQEKA